MGTIIAAAQQMPELVPFIDKSGELTAWSWALIVWLCVKGW